MKHVVLTLIMSSLLSVKLIAQSDNIVYRYFFKVDSTYVIVDDSKDNWFTIEIKADTLSQNEDNGIIYDNRKLLQINVIPFSDILPNLNKSISIPEALQVYKKWELDYQQKELQTKLKSGQEFYYRDNKPFVIWWYKNTSATKKNKSDNIDIEYDFETGTFVNIKTLNVTHMLYLNFSIYGRKNVALTIPVFEDENLLEEIDKLKDVANSLRVYGGNIDMDVLVDIKHFKENYVLRDSLNLLELEVPDWLNVIKPPYDNSFSASFPERYEAVNAMIIVWQYKSDSLSFNDFVNRIKVPHEKRPNYRLIEKNDSTLKYFYTSENGWFHQQNVYLKGDSIYCLINFTATKNTYDYNILRFEEIARNLKLK
jgi:hypothetical protein